MRQTAAYRVSGRVQGVSFRMATQQEARRLGLVGWVQNRADGSVAGMATGEEEQLAGFREWLHSGPSLARVTDVEWEEQPLEEFSGFFEIR